MNRSSHVREPAHVQSLEPRLLLAADLSPRGLLIITGTEGADTITVDLDVEGAQVTVSGATEADVSFPARRVRMVLVRTGAGDDVVTVGEMPHRVLVRLGEGNDELLSSARFTHASGGAGDDSLAVQHEDPDVAPDGGPRGGGPGDSPGDRARRDNRRFAAFGAVLLAGGDGADTLVGSPRARLNRLVGGAGDDHLSVPEDGRGRGLMFGGEGSDTLIGGASGDMLLGLAGNDSIFGRGGNDLLVGGEDDDEIFGENGDDTLIGGPGTDTLDGGAGDNDLRDD